MNATLTAVPGVWAGHHTHPAGTTGATAVLFPEGAVAAVFVAGAAPGSRELAVLEPRHLTDRIHGLCLAGGSAFGLAAADGVMAVLAERGVGLPTPGGVVPLVPAAILYDLEVGPHRPDAASGRAAAEAASDAPLVSGRVGAGAGARVGASTGRPVRAGFATAATPLGDRVVGVGVAVNAFGAIVHADGALPAGVATASPPLGAHTTLAVVATDVPLTKGQAATVARMASAGMARALSPAFTPFDGDVVFVASTGHGVSGPIDVTRVGAAAASLLAASIRAVAVPA